VSSITSRPNGHQWIQFRGLAGKRQTLRLGKVTREAASTIKGRVDRLLAAQAMQQAPDLETARWVGSLSVKLHAKLAALGLVEPRAVATLTELFAAFEKEYPGKDGTRRNLQETCRSLLVYFGDCPPGLISPREARDYQLWLPENVNLRGGGLATATADRRIRRARQLFRFAIDNRWVPSNPFDGLKCSREVNRNRDFFVDANLTAQVLAEISDPGFRAIVCLARYGGLRCPSEILRLEWAEVNWEKGLLDVFSPKTNSRRTVPLFPPIEKTLSVLWDRAEPGEALIFGRRRFTKASLASRLQVVCRRAGIALWPKPWQNMRATRETELLEEFPLHVVVAWLGHSAKISTRHYAQVTDDHISKALLMGKNVLRLATGENQGEAKGEAVRGGQGRSVAGPAERKPPESQGFRGQSRSGPATKSPRADGAARP